MKRDEIEDCLRAVPTEPVQRVLRDFNSRLEALERAAASKQTPNKPAPSKSAGGKE